MECREYKFKVRVVKEMTVTVDGDDTVEGLKQAQDVAVEECCDFGELVDSTVERME